MRRSLNDELAEIDKAIAELENRRSNVINQMSAKTSALGGEGKTATIQKVKGIIAKKSGLPVSSGTSPCDSGVLSNVVLIRQPSKERNIYE